MSPARTLVILLVATAYATLFAALVGRSPPVWFVSLLLVTLLVAVHSGIFFLNLSVFEDAVSRRPRGAKTVALTFDDGPHPVHTAKVLDLLDEAGAKATFFVIGAKVDAHPEVVREVVRRGHEIGLHSYAHDHILFCRPERRIAADIVRTQDAVERAAGVRPKLFRPPVGFSSPRTRAVVRRLQLVVVGWSARAFDGAGRPTADRILARLAPKLRDGAIVLLHDAAERGDVAPTSLEALPAVLQLLRERQLRPVTLSSLLGEERTVEAPSSRPSVEPREAS